MTVALKGRPRSDELVAMPIRLLTCAVLTGLLALVPGVADARGHPGRHPARGAGAGGGRLIWSDEFNGPAGAPPDPSRWTFDVGGGGWGNGELEYYTSRRGNSALDGHGHLAIVARRERFGEGAERRGYTSARLKTEGVFSTTFGRIEASIKLPGGRGLWPAFWAVGENIETVGWPASGEIDMMESLGNDPFTLYGSLHGPERGTARGYGLTTPHRSGTSLAAGFHVYGASWSPSAITFTFDGVPYATRTAAQLSPGQRWVFNKPFFLILNLAVGGDWPGEPGASTPFPATMLVDWVRVYSG